MSGWAKSLFYSGLSSIGWQQHSVFWNTRWDNTRAAPTLQARQAKATASKIYKAELAHCCAHACSRDSHCAHLDTERTVINPAVILAYSWTRQFGLSVEIVPNSSWLWVGGCTQEVLGPQRETSHVPDFVVVGISTPTSLSGLPLSNCDRAHSSYEDWSSHMSPAIPPVNATGWSWIRKKILNQSVVTFMKLKIVKVPHKNYLPGLQAWWG